LPPVFLACDVIGLGRVGKWCDVVAVGALLASVEFAMSCRATLLLALRLRFVAEADLVQLAVLEFADDLLGVEVGLVPFEHEAR